VEDFVGYMYLHVHSWGLHPTVAYTYGAKRRLLLMCKVLLHAGFLGWESTDLHTTICSRSDGSCRPVSWDQTHVHDNLDMWSQAEAAPYARGSPSCRLLGLKINGFE
jgi:hypothetical protein